MLVVLRKAGIALFLLLLNRPSFLRTGIGIWTVVVFAIVLRASLSNTTPGMPGKDPVTGKLSIALCYFFHTTLVSVRSWLWGNFSRPFVAGGLCTKSPRVYLSASISRQLEIAIIGGRLLISRMSYRESRHVVSTSISKRGMDAHQALKESSEQWRFSTSVSGPCSSTVHMARGGVSRSQLHISKLPGIASQ